MPQKQGKSMPKPGKFHDSSDDSPGTCSSTDKRSGRRTRQTGDTDMRVTRLSSRKRSVPTNLSSPEILETESQLSSEEKRPQRGREVPQKPEQNHSLSSNQSSEEEFTKPKTTNRSRRRNKKPHEQQKSIKIPPAGNPLPTSKKHHTQKPIQEEDEWTEEELSKLQEWVSLPNVCAFAVCGNCSHPEAESDGFSLSRVVSRYPKHIAGYWEKVARMVGTRTAEECHKKHTSQGASRSPEKTDRRQKRGKEAAKPPGRIGSCSWGRARRFPDCFFNDVWICAQRQRNPWYLPEQERWRGNSRCGSSWRPSPETTWTMLSAQHTCGTNSLRCVPEGFLQRSRQ